MDEKKLLSWKSKIIFCLTSRLGSDLDDMGHHFLITGGNHVLYFYRLVWLDRLYSLFHFILVSVQLSVGFVCPP